ncbi:unnamed protein product, partial [Meganyctiphanes norvegica]
MKTSVIQAFLLCAILAGCQAGIMQSLSEMKAIRQAKQIFNQLTGFGSRNSPQYPLCQVDDIEGACLPEARCMAEDGRYAGFCGMTSDVCCIVDKTCGTATKAHGSYFHNPSYPKKDNESRACPFTIYIDREVCAVRLDFLDFELAPYGDGVCVTDTLTVLGTKLGLTTPVCGNMTGWTTTFAVDEETDITLAMVVQGDPAYKFSIRATQIGCRDINVFQSPTYSGVHNEDAVEYVSTSTTAKPTPPTPITPEPTTTMFPDSEKDGDDDDGDGDGDVDGDGDGDDDDADDAPTTLRTAEWPTAKPRDT